MFPEFRPRDDSAVRPQGRCPVAPYGKGPDGYAASVSAWLADPHAYFTAFGPEARAFQKRNRSERLRTMTLVADAAELAAFAPVQIALDGRAVRVASWQDAFAVALTRLAAAHPASFAALQAADELAWLGCPAGGAPVAERLGSEEGVRPVFGALSDVVYRIQWLFLMCGVRLNEVVVQVDPYTDETWAARREELRRKRRAQQEFMAGRREAQRAWALAHPEEPVF